MRPQAHDIIRTWAFYTIVKAWMHDNDIPWHTIVISGHVLADSKEKLSKSKENASTSPQGLLRKISGRCYSILDRIRRPGPRYCIF